MHSAGRRHLHEQKSNIRPPSKPDNTSAGKCLISSASSILPRGSQHNCVPFKEALLARQIVQRFLSGTRGANVRLTAQAEQILHVAMHQHPRGVSCISFPQREGAILAWNSASTVWPAHGTPHKAALDHFQSPGRAHQSFA